MPDPAFQPALFDDLDEQSPPYGIDQASLALVPFPSTKTDRTQPLTIQYRAVVDGKKRNIEVVLRPGANLELPSQHDQVLLLALLQMSHERRSYTNLRLRRSEVFARVGWPQTGPRYQQFEGAMRRLNGVSVEFESELISRTGKPYKRRMKLSHLVNKIDVLEDDTVLIEWGDLIQQAFELGDFKRLDWNLALSLPSPLTVALYRFLDRVVLTGETTYQIGWKTLTAALGMGTNYARPARFREAVEPHITALVEHGIIGSWSYGRGGVFTFELTNYLRAQLRRILVERGVYPEAARQLLAAHAEMEIIRQIDQLHYRAVSTPGGYLVEAVRTPYDVRYPPEESEAFAGLFELLLSDEQRAHLRFAERLTGYSHHGDPSTWPLDLRICIRFMVTHSLDPEKCK